MNLQLPKNEMFPTVQIIVSHPHGHSITTLDDSHKEVDIPVPQGVHPDEVEIYAQFCGKDGKPHPQSAKILLKAAVPHEDPPADPPQDDPPQDDPPQDDPPADPPHDEIEADVDAPVDLSDLVVAQVTLAADPPADEQ